MFYFFQYFKHYLWLCFYKIQRVLLAYFAVAGLDVLNELDKLPHTKQALIDWIYMHQITEKLFEVELGICGFRGSSTLLSNENVINLI